MALHKLCKHSSVEIHPQPSLSFKMKSLQHKPDSNLTIFLPQPPLEYLALQVNTTRPGYKGFFLVSSLICIQNVLPIPFLQSMPILDFLHRNLQLFNSKVVITCNCAKYTSSKEIVYFPLCRVQSLAISTKVTLVFTFLSKGQKIPLLHTQPSVHHIKTLRHFVFQLLVT